jgi:hypothetical protein
LLINGPSIFRPERNEQLFDALDTLFTVLT